MRGGLKTFRLGTKISIVVSVLLTATLLVGVAIIYQFERTRLEEDIREKTHRVLSSIQSSHTQSMLKRGEANPTSE